MILMFLRDPFPGPLVNPLRTVDRHLTFIVVEFQPCWSGQLLAKVHVVEARSLVVEAEFQFQQFQFQFQCPICLKLPAATFLTITLFQSVFYLHCFYGYKVSRKACINATNKNVPLLG